MSKLVCGLTACFVFLDPVPSTSMEQQHQKSIASALPPSPAGDVRPTTHLATLEKPCELGATGESRFLLSGTIFPAQCCGSAFPWFSVIYSDQASGVVNCSASKRTACGLFAVVIGVGRGWGRMPVISTHFSGHCTKVGGRDKSEKAPKLIFSPA